MESEEWKVIQQLKKLAVLYLACLVAGTLALTAVYCLPVRAIQEHVRVSVDAFLEEGDNPFVLSEYKGSSLDNTTDAIMLGNAVYQSDLPAYQAAMKAGRAELDNEHTQLALKKYLDQDLGLTLTSYERYWHGYLVVLKPLLLVFNYVQIRILNGIVMAILVLLILRQLWKRDLRRGMLAFLLSVAGLFPMALPYSLQFSTSFYVGAGASLFLLCRYEKIKEKEQCIEMFFLAGALTSYVDFLTYPIYALGIPLVLCIVLDNENIGNELKRIVACTCSWGSGYLLMWAGKWLIGSALLKENIFADALQTVMGRASGEVGAEQISRIMAVLRNFYIYFNLYGVLLAGILILWVGIWCFRNRKVMKMDQALLLLLVAAGPICWYLVTANHAYIHYWFTFRNLSVSIFAFAMITETGKTHRKGEVDS